MRLQPLPGLLFCLSMTALAPGTLNCWIDKADGTACWRSGLTTEDDCQHDLNSWP